MRLELRPEPSRRHGIRERLSRHAWIVILVLVMASMLALCGRSASAQVNRADEIIDKTLVPKPGPSGGAGSIETTASAVEAAGYPLSPQCRPF